MAPEVVAGKPYDARCDWWSIGIILYECLYGHTPFLSEEGRHMTKSNILVSPLLSVPMGSRTYITYHGPLQKHKELFEFPTQPVVSHRCRDLIRSLIQDPEDRLSSRRYKLKDLAASSPSLASLPRASSSSKVPTKTTTNPSTKPAPRDHTGRYVFPRDAEDIKSHKWFRGIP
jgi:serine/threonine protein kinase